MTELRRRAFLGAAALLGGCARPDDWRTRVAGRWVGDDAALGHRVRDAAAHPPPPARERRCDVLVVGGGIAGLAAARALAAADVDDFAVLELESEAGGNSRGWRMRGLGCPLGAHYLPLPGPAADDIRDWLVGLGLARRGAAGLEWDERQLCHSPQERLFIDGRWQEGLLPAAAPDSPTQAQYRLLARRVAEVGRAGFALPTARAPWTPAHAALDAVTFDAWLDAQGLADRRLRTYLDYCCRDDYGAGSGVVSAWAGLHYFASRHGFRAPGEGDDERDAVLTWPDGNAPLARALRAPLGERVAPGRAVFRVEAGEREVQAWAFAGDAVERWTARHVVLATPLFIAARVLRAPPPALAEVARTQRHAPWLVANLLLDRPPLDRVGAPPSWDNVIHGSPSLGYVDARHQERGLDGLAGPRLVTVYWALPDGARRELLTLSWQDATQRILDDLHVVHPDLGERLLQVDLARHGHAMAIPVPGMRSSAALAALPDSLPRASFAHADLSAYSVFEEAFTRGDAAGRRAARLVRAKR